MTTAFSRRIALLPVALLFAACSDDAPKPAADGAAAKGSTTAAAASALSSSSLPPPRTPALMRRVDPGLDSSKPINHAVALLEATEGNEAAGTITLDARGDTPGLKVTAKVDGLPPGRHAFHVHLLGDCSAPDGKSAGTHFNFKGSSTEPPSDVERITGNLGELVADESGHAEASFDVPDARLQGPYAVIGRSIIVHAAANDPQKPPIGGAGARLACGVIGVGRSSEDDAS